MELWKRKKPSYKFLRVWVCLAKVLVPKPKKVKIGPKIVDCIFIGYVHNNIAYRFLVHESKIHDIHKDTIMESINASFFEHVFPRKSKEISSSLKRTRETISDNEYSDNKEHKSIYELETKEEPRRSKRARVEKSFRPNFLTYLLENEPQTYSQVVHCLNGPF